MHPLSRGRNTYILDIIKFHKDRGGVGFEVDQFDGTVAHGRKDAIAGWGQGVSGSARTREGNEFRTLGHPKQALNGWKEGTV